MKAGFSYSQRLASIGDLTFEREGSIRITPGLQLTDKKSIKLSPLRCDGQADFAVAESGEGITSEGEVPRLMSVINRGSAESSCCCDRLRTRRRCTRFRPAVSRFVASGNALSAMVAECELLLSLKNAQIVSDACLLYESKAAADQRCFDSKFESSAAVLTRLGEGQHGGRDIAVPPCCRC